MPRLPQPGFDEGTWGGILNDYLSVAHAADGTLKPNTVTASQLAPSSVANGSIAENSVTGGKLAASSITPAKLSASNPASGQVLSYNGTGFEWITPASGVTDHGLLSGLSDDDHPQYHTDARGDARYYTKAQVDASLSGKANTSHTHVISDTTGLQTQLDSKANTASLATVATTGAYADLTGRPTLATVATTGAYADLTGAPALAPVATSGAYGDLSGRPTLGTAAAAATSDFATAAQGATADAAVQPGDLATVATTGAYADLTGTYADQMWLSAAVFSATFGAPDNNATLNGAPMLRFDATVLENAATTVVIPSSWNTFHIDAWWTNVSTGTGNVVWQARYRFQVNTNNMANGDISGTYVTSTAPAQNIITVTRAISNVVRQQGALFQVSYRRNGADAADTLTNDSGFFGYMLTRAS